MAKDYYEVLGIDKSADINKIKKAYRKLAIKFHPDKSPNDAVAAEKFRAATEAYEVLSDNSKRAKYDQFGSASFEGQENGFGGGFNFDKSHAAYDFADIFGNMFEGGRPTKTKGESIQCNLKITLEQAASAQEAVVELPEEINCDLCFGSGARRGTSASTCSECGGSGSIGIQRGFLTTNSVCGGCRGSGRRIASPCIGCRGSGKKTRARRITINVPRGVYDGVKVRVSGKGKPSLNGGPAGDLFVNITILKHDVFTRDGKDLYCNVPITFSQAVFGGEVGVPTLCGGVEMKVPAGTSTGTRLRVRGKGVFDIKDGEAGDLYVDLNLVTPKKLSAGQSDLLRKFTESTKDDDYPERTSFLKKAKVFLNNISKGAENDS